MIRKVFDQFRYLSSDLKRWKCVSIRDAFYAVFEQGVWATVLYRVSRALFLIDVPVLKILFRLVAFFLMKFSEYFLGAAVKPEADIGPGFYIGHTGLIRVHPKAKAGKNFSIGPGVILGEKGLGEGGAPSLGDNVYVGTGSKILGALKIGNNVKIGANAVVVKDIPDGATAVGVPAKIIYKEK